MSYTEELHVPSPPGTGTSDNRKREREKKRRKNMVIDGVRCLEEGTADEQVEFMIDHLDRLKAVLRISSKYGSNGRKINKLSSEKNPLIIEGKKTYEELLRLLIISKRENLIEDSSLIKYIDMAKDLNAFFASERSGKHSEYIFNGFCCCGYTYSSRTVIPITGYN